MQDRPGFDLLKAQGFYPRSPGGPSISMATIDWAGLRRSSMEDAVLAAELIELFLADTRVQIAAVAGRIDERDAEATRRSAHQLKGGCLTIGAERMAEVCDQLETACESRSLDELAHLGRRLSEEFAEVTNELRDPGWEARLLGGVLEDLPQKRR